MDWIQQAGQAIATFMRQVDMAAFAALAIVFGLAVVALLLANVMAARRLVRHVAELRDAGDDQADRQRELLEAILRQINGCAIDIAHLKQQLNTYTSTRENQLEERKKILKSIAGHLANAPQRNI